MSRVNFFTPVRYKGHNSLKHCVYNSIETYFYLGGKKAYVIPNSGKDGERQVDIIKKRNQLSPIKAASYLTGIIPLIMIIAKILFRATHKFQAVSSEQTLQKGVVINEDIKNSVASIMGHVLKRNSQQGVTYYNSQANHRVFSLDSAPGLVFKLKADKKLCVVGRDDSMRARYQSMIFAERVCRIHNLGLLTIPRAKLFTVPFKKEKFDVIAEQKLNISSEKSIQDQKLIQQLIVFIAKTGFSDVEWRNIPLTNDGKIALIDIEEMKRPEQGIFGQKKPARRGLVRCVDREHIDFVIKQARKHGIYHKENAAAAKIARLRELDDDKVLKEFYREKNIISGNELLKVDLNCLGLDLQQTQRFFVKNKSIHVTLAVATKFVVDAINKAIQSMSDKPVALKQKRRMLLDINKDVFGQFDNFMLGNKSWLFCIVDALVAHGYLYKIECHDDRGYIVQA